MKVYPIVGRHDYKQETAKIEKVLRDRAFCITVGFEIMSYNGVWNKMSYNGVRNYMSYNWVRNHVSNTSTCLHLRVGT